MYTKVTTEPTVEPVSLEEAKLHLKVDNTADDVLITGLIQAARQACENYEAKAYCIKTYTAKMNFLQSVCLPYPPLAQVDAITYIDENEDTQTLSTDVYGVDTHSEPGIVYLKSGQTWPTVNTELNAVSIVYKAGYMTQFTVSGDTLTVNEAVLAEDEAVRLSTDQGDLPDPLQEKVTYYAINVSGNTLELSETVGGSAITLTDAGTGTFLIGKNTIPSRINAAIKLILSHLYEHREDESEITLHDMTFNAKSLLFDRNTGV